MRIKGAGVLPQDGAIVLQLPRLPLLKTGLNDKVPTNLNIEKGGTGTMRTCPKCGKEYQEHPAISRADNVTEICPDCGTLEALEAAGISKEAQDEILKTIHETKKGAGL